MTTESKITNNPKLITLNCSGGISLGAYMAGVFYELTKEAVKPNPKIIIDIITGASAGAMTGVIAAYCLLSADREKLFDSDITKNVFYKAWVEKVDIKLIDSFSVTLNSFKDGFLATQDSFSDSFLGTIERYDNSKNKLLKFIATLLKKVTPDYKSSNPNYKRERSRKKLSILSGEAIEEIAKLVGLEEKPDQVSRILGTSKNIPQFTENTQPLALLMTVTNLQGLLESVNLSQSPTEKEEFKTITYGETRLFLFQSGLRNEPYKLNNMWQKAVKGGLASGAFPAAFPPKWDESNIDSINLETLSEDYFTDSRKIEINREEVKALYGDYEHLNFLYSDGGILNSLPILQGIDLIQELRYLQEEDDDYTKEFKRKFFANKPQDSSERLHVYIRPIPVEDLQSNKRLTKGHFSLLEIALSGLTLPQEEHDSLRFREIEKRNQLVEAKRKLLKRSNWEQRHQLQQQLNQAIPYEHIELRPITATLISNIDDHITHPKLSQLQPVYDALLKQIRKNNPKAQLQEGGAAELLASDFLGAFGGFFDKRYREHDFLIGRICGIAWILENCEGVTLTENEINELICEIQGTGKRKAKILTEDPTPSNLKLSQKIRIGRLILRTLRIVLIEAKIVGLFWIVFLGILNLAFILILALLEIVATLALMIADLFETIWDKVSRK
jgi:predicted acylesterase/phospholipase RssA